MIINQDLNVVCMYNKTLNSKQQYVKRDVNEQKLDY